MRRQAPARMVPAGAPHGGMLRAWLQTLVAALWARSEARRFSLRTLLRHNGRPKFLPARSDTARRANRRPRRLAASEGWFSFAAR
jgi:hypothetical protein